MAATFDPYEQWLGIRPHEHPVDHYRLLGLARFESDPAVIAAAADRWMSHVRTFQTGRRAVESQKILTLLSAAKTCLLDRDTKATYDAVLQGLLSVNAAPSGHAVAAVPAAVASPPPVAPAAPPAMPRAPAVGVAPQHDAYAADDEPSAGPPLGLIVLAVACLLLLVVGGIGAVAVIGLASRPAVVAPPPLPVAPPVPSTEGAASVDDVQLISQSEDGTLFFPAERAALEGSARLERQGDRQVVTGAAATDDVCRWRFELDKPAAFRIDATYASSAESAGGQFTLEVGREVTKPLSVRDTGGVDTFTSERIGFIWIRSKGSHELVLRPVALPEGAPLMILESLRLTPVRGAGQ